MPPRPSPQTERLVSLVEAVAARPDQGMTLSEIARHLGVAPATCHPMLASLTDSGWLVRHPTRRTYRLGPALITVGNAARRGLDVVELVRPALERVCAEFGCGGVTLTPGESHVTVADIVPGPHTGRRLRIGDLVPTAPPLGVGYICWADERCVNRWLERTGARAEHEKVVAAARERGYTVELVTPMESELAGTLARLDDEPESLPDGSAGRLRHLLEELAGELDGRQPGNQVVDIAPQTEYRVGRIAAPVRERDELAVIVSLHGFGPALPGSEVMRAGTALARAARTATARLAG